MSTDSKLKTCDLCCHDPAAWVVSECGHHSCLTCAARLRILCEQKECPVCHLELDQVRAKFAHHSPATFYYSLASLVLWTQPSSEEKKASLVPCLAYHQSQGRFQGVYMYIKVWAFPYKAPGLPHKWSLKTPLHSGHSRVSFLAFSARVLTSWRAGQ